MFTKPLIEHILLHANTYDWTVQGFGMIRTYLGPKDNPKQIRLNVWDRSVAVHNVSTIHDHPWDFESLIVAGAFVNVRYDMVPNMPDCTHNGFTIKTGIGGGVDPNQQHFAVSLIACRPELYGEGMTYRQTASEIHESLPFDGTVTINNRVGDTEQARVFWPACTKWVDAIPRRATTAEVERITNSALARWF